MITRIYIDNYKSFVNFEWKPGRLALLLGDNGSGKSSLMEVLAGLRGIIAEQETILDWFPKSSRARWESRLELCIELDVTIQGQAYSYQLGIEYYTDDFLMPLVRSESLSIGGRQLMEFEDGELQVYRDDGTAFRFTADTARSGLGRFAGGKDQKLLAMFTAWFRDDLWYFAPDPRHMSSRTDEDSTGPARDLHNFASWLPRWMAQDFAGATAAMQSLRQAIDGLVAVQVSKSAPRLEATFQGDGAKYAVGFDELSDGQRQLCALYFILHATVQPGRFVFFDEPDNYVALREIQPWLNEVVEHALSESGPQVWFVSHNAEIINQLAATHGTRFFRHKGGPTRIEPFQGVDGLTPGETVARGWDGE